MKKRLIILVFLIIVVIFIAGCLNQNEKGAIVSKNKTTEPLSQGIVTNEQPAEKNINLPPHCKDGLYNAGEEGLDCGWTCPNKCKFIEKCGEINQDEIWEGNIYASCFVNVKDGATLTIQPGTIVKFHSSKDYKNFDKAGLYTVGGNIKAIGIPEKMIWFTSDARDPINGDWVGITVDHTPDSKFDHVIVEFGELGLSQIDSSVPITNSIIRWSNSEGLYQERSTPIIINNTLYGNGYHEIAMEQYNKNAQVKNNLFRDGKVAIHHEKTTSLIEGNYFKNYPEYVISAGMQSEISVKNNWFENINTQNPGGQPTLVYDGSTETIADNKIVSGADSQPHFDYDDQQNFKLWYIPGHEDDKYPYVYADADNTRKVLKKLGKDLYFGWSLLYAKNYLWRFSLGAGEFGRGMDFIKINPETGQYIKFGSNEIMNPRGLAYDGEYFYVNDFSLLKIFKFKLKENAKQGDFIEVVDSFDIPEKELGGTMGLTSDGNFFYHKSRDGSKLHKIDKNGNLLGEIKFENPTAMQCLVYTGEYFWTCGGCGKGICKFTADGTLAGEIYPAAKDPWDLAWDGKYLWALYRTSENWNDHKIYQMEILDDSLE